MVWKVLHDRPRGIVVGGGRPFVRCWLRPEGRCLLAFHLNVGMAGT